MSAYGIDSRRGRFTVQAFAEGMLSSFGHNPTLAAREFFGRLDFDGFAPNDASLRMSVASQSLEVTDQVSKKDRAEIESRARDEVLEAAKYPEIVYSSTSIEATKIGEAQYRLHVKGKLSLHGVHRDQDANVQLRVGESETRLRGEFRVKQSDFRIKRVSALGGAIRVKDELLVSFELIAIRIES